MPSCEARKLIPRKIEPKKTPIRISTVPALRGSGGRKAGTPFETASVPVSATDPAAKARRMSRMPERLRRRGPRAIPAAACRSGSVPLATARCRTPRSAVDRDQVDVGRDRRRASRSRGCRAGCRATAARRSPRRRHAPVEEAREDRGQRRDAGRDGDGDGQHVVGQQGAGGHQAGTPPEVVAGHDVRAAAVGIGADGLLVADHHDGQHDHDRRPSAAWSAPGLRRRPAPAPA